MSDGSVVGGAREIGHGDFGQGLSDMASGALHACLEGVLFEWLGDARAPEFKAAHRLVV